MYRYIRYNESVYSEKPAITNLFLSNSGRKTGYYDFFLISIELAGKTLFVIEFYLMGSNKIRLYRWFLLLYRRKEDKAAKNHCILEFFMMGSNIIRAHYEKFEYTGGFCCFFLFSTQ